MRRDATTWDATAGDPARGRTVGLVLATVALSAVWLVLGTPVTAAAQGATCTAYAPTPLTVTPTTIGPGSVVTLRGVALPNASVTITLRRPDGTTAPLTTGAASATGTFSIQATLPADLSPGAYQLIATSPNCPVPFTVVVTIPGGQQPPGSTTTTTAAATTTTVAGGGGAGSTTAVPTSVLPSVQEVGSGVRGTTEARAASSASGSPSATSDSPSSTEGALAFTGGEVRPYIVVAIAVIAVGALLVGSSRRRTS